MTERICSIEDCAAPVHSRGWCNRHYKRWQQHGDPHVTRRYDHRVAEFCSVEGCGKPHEGLGYCKNHRRLFKLYGDPLGSAPSRALPPSQWAMCEVDRCEERVRSPYATLCATHYHRRYRHGYVGAVAPAIRPPRVGAGYRTAWMPHHPVAGKGGMAYVHRAMLYDAIGPGEHACHWCGTVVSWDIPYPTRGCLVTDHLNNDPYDNRIDNLVPACQRCNVGRGQQRKHEILVSDGFWSANDTIARLRNGGRKPRIEPRE